MPRKTLSKAMTAAPVAASTKPVTVTAGRGKHSDFCAYLRSCSLKPSAVRGKLRKHGLHGPYTLNDPKVHEIVEKIVAARQPTA